MTEDESKRLWESRFWEQTATADLALFQLYEPRMCMPFEIFQEALERSLGRLVAELELVHGRELLRHQLTAITGCPPSNLLSLLPDVAQRAFFPVARKIA